MPRRRSHGLTFATAAARAGIVFLAGVFALSGCQPSPDDIGCSVTRQLVIPGTTPLALLTDVHIDRAGDGLVLFGNDGTSLHWILIDGAGTIGAEQTYPLPPDTLRVLPALAGVDAPRDRVIIGLLVPAANGTDAELRVVAAPADGSEAPLPGPPITTFGDGVSTPPIVALGPSEIRRSSKICWKTNALGPLLRVTCASSTSIR